MSQAGFSGDIQPRRTSPAAGPSSPSTSSGVFISQSDGNSTSSLPIADTQSLGITDHIASIRLSQDIPIPSVEPSSDDSSGGVHISRRTIHSRTPSLSLSPPLADMPESEASPRNEEISRDHSALMADDGIDGRLGMSQIAAAIDDIANGSQSSRDLLSPEPPRVSNDSSHGQEYRRRSSSRTPMASHKVADEEPPHDRFHEPIFQAALSQAQQFISTLTDVLSGSSLSRDPDSTMRRLYDEGGRLAQFRCLPHRTVGFVGDSGAGKSSLLNSLLDFKGLARTSNIGEACTCVATEYHFHSRTDFAIDVEWFDMNDIGTQLTELVQSYQRYNHRTDEDRPDLDALKARADVAIHTFRAMFRGRLQDENFLTRSSGAIVTETLKSWAAEFLRALAGGHEEQSSVEECSTVLTRLTTDESSIQEPAKWPYIRKIKVFLNAHILSKGLVLVDLPGLRDSNSARRNITERYMLQCDEIFAICNIGRATTDASVVSIFDLARQARLSNVGIICTQSDNIQAGEAVRDWPGERATLIQRWLDRIAIDRRDADNIQADLDQLADDDNLPERGAAKLYDLNRQYRELKKQKKQHEYELKKYLIDTRNATVKQALSSKYNDTIPGNALKIFCASNTEYWEHRDLPKNVSLCHLELSGILAIRKNCISMVADRQLQIATKYIKDDIPAFLADIELWVQSGAGSVDAEQRETIRETLSILEARFNRELAGNSSQIRTIARSLKEEFGTRIFETRQISDWTRAATNVSNVWSTEWTAQSYKAFCFKYGNHQTGAVGRHNWNEEAIELMARDLGISWEALKVTLYRDLEGFQSRVAELMDWAIAYIDTEIHNSSESAITLGQSMISRQHLLLADIERVCDDFYGELDQLRTLALSGLRTSLIGQLMEDSYRRCNIEEGRGSHSQRKAIINGKLQSQETFETLLRRFRSSFSIRVDSFQNDIQTAIATHLEAIKNTMDILRSENVVLESERVPEFRARVGREVRQIKIEMRRIQEVIGS